VAVARFVGVDRRTILNWRVAGQVHAQALPRNRWAVYVCPACPGARSRSRCARCRQIFGENGEKREIKSLDGRLKRRDGFKVDS
jgi:hypothetical protein